MTEEHCIRCNKKFEWRERRYYERKNNTAIYCRKCIEEYAKNHIIIRHHYPGCVERDDAEFYEWKGYDQFLKDNPPDEGWHWEISVDKWNRCDDHIMLVSDDGYEWWVIWNSGYDSIREELLKRIPKFKPKYKSESHNPRKTGQKW